MRGVKEAPLSASDARTLRGPGACVRGAGRAFRRRRGHDPGGAAARPPGGGPGAELPHRPLPAHRHGAHCDRADAHGPRARARASAQDPHATGRHSPLYDVPGLARAPSSRPRPPLAPGRNPPGGGGSASAASEAVERGRVPPTPPPATSVTADAAEHSWPADARPGSTRRCPKVVHLTLLRGALMGPSSCITQRPSLDGTDRTHGAGYAPGDPRHMTRDYPVSETLPVPMRGDLP